MTSSGTTKYYLDNSGHVIAETDTNDQLTAQIIWGHTALARKINNAYYYYIYNGHGDVVQILDENGNIVNSYTYDEWGNILSATEQIPNPIRYAGEYYDEESGLYYLGARYYDPSIQRFISEDPHWNVNNMIYGDNLYKSVVAQVPDVNAIRQSSNLYAYALNDPNMYVDSNGEIVGTITGALVGGIIGGVSAAYQGKDVKTGIVSGGVSGAIVGAGADIIALSAGIGAPAAIGMMSILGAVGTYTGNVIEQIGNNWKWGAGTQLSISAKNIDQKSAVRSAIIGGMAGGLAGATGQILVVAQKTSIDLYKFALLSGASKETIDATGRALINSATNSFIYDTATGAIYSITANGIEYYSSIKN